MKQETMKSLKKSLDILNLFLSQNTELTLGEISKLSGLNSSTASRIVAVLVKYNYLKHRERKGKYSLGPIYLYFSRIFNSRTAVKRIIIPHLTKLSQQLNEPCVFAFENGIQGFFPERISDPSLQNKLLIVAPSEGRSIPLHCTSIGKIFLANVSEKDLQKYFKSNSLERYTPKTITDVNKMNDQLIEIKQKGVAFDKEEFELGVCGIAAKLVDSEGELIGAIGITSPSIRLNRANIKKITPLVKNCAMEISRELGFQD
jgi:DNA-binding IclR family transcriptional regulator